MLILRAAVGFLFFLLAFWLRAQTAGTAWFGVAVGLSALGTMAGNACRPASAPGSARRRCCSARSACRRWPASWPPLLGGVAAGVLLAVVVNFAAAVGRLAFESIVQRDAPEANRGRAFARFETRFQLAWAVAGLMPVRDQDPRLGRVPHRRAGVRGGDAQLRRRHPLVEPRLRRRRLPRPQIPWRRRPARTAIAATTARGPPGPP